MLLDPVCANGRGARGNRADHRHTEKGVEFEAMIKVAFADAGDVNQLRSAVLADSSRCNL
jgi:hypothetical protein